MNVALATRIWRKLLVTWWGWTVPLSTRLPGYKAASGVRYLGRPEISMAPESSIRVGARAVLCSDVRFTALGVSRPVILRTLRPGATIEVGADTGMSGVAICAAVSVSIGEKCLLGSEVMIFDTDFHALEPSNRRYNQAYSDVDSKPVVIGENVFIGARSTIMKGARIGANSVIAAGSVVRGNIPDNCIAGGVPARVLRHIKPRGERNE